LTTSSEIQIRKLVVGPVSTNCFIIWDEGTKEGAIIDPGEEAERILEIVVDLELNIKYILATHCHFDHIAGIPGLKRELDAEFLAHVDDISFIEESQTAAGRWGFEIEQCPMPDNYAKEGDELEIGDLKMTVIHLPGHSPGGVGYLCGDVLFSGDTLFQGSIGRTDFRMGSLEILSKSIRERLYTLPNDTKVMTGHGPSTTIGAEKASNMFVRGDPI